jgi:hypothetical protein
MADDQNQPPIAPPPAAIPPPPPVPATPMAMGFANNSGQGPGTPVPPEIQGWSWAGFLMNWIWAIPHKAWLAFALGVIPLVLGFGSHPLGSLVLVSAILCGIKGNEWAWQNRQWQSLEQFRATQRAWVIWGLILLALWILLVTIIVIAGAALLGALAIGAANANS